MEFPPLRNYRTARDFIISCALVTRGLDPLPGGSPSVTAAFFRDQLAEPFTTGSGNFTATLNEVYNDANAYRVWMQNETMNRAEAEWRVNYMAQAQTQRQAELEDLAVRVGGLDNPTVYEIELGEDGGRPHAIAGFTMRRRSEIRDNNLDLIFEFRAPHDGVYVYARDGRYYHRLEQRALNEGDHLTERHTLSLDILERMRTAERQQRTPHLNRQQLDGFRRAMQEGPTPEEVQTPATRGEPV